jgi:hypothetical protein
MTSVIPENTWLTETDTFDPGVESCSDNMGEIVIVSLDHSMAYAVPTWCASSPAS